MDNDPVRYILATQQQARERDMLTVWTVYDHPSDFPDDYVARCFVTKDGNANATENFLTDPSLTSLRGNLTMAGLVCLTRSEGDDQKIVETWL